VVKNARGFTLVELAAVAAIIAALAAFAVAAYDDHARRARRSDALIALTRIAALQERHHREHLTYAATLTALGAAARSPAGHYTLSIAPGANAAAYQAVATATATGLQAADGACRKFTLTASGVRAAADKDNKDATAECWR